MSSSSKSLKNLFLITSVLVPANTPLSYINTRSLYSPEERFSQTKNTIKTIREKVPNSYIYLIEGSKISLEMEKELQNKVDKYINFSDNKEVMSNVNDPQKSKGEVSLLLNGLKDMDNLDSFENVFKISGRYYLNDKFKIENFNNNFNNFQLCDDRYATTMYKIHRIHLRTYIEALTYSLNHIDHGIERALYIVYPPNHPNNRCIPEVGVSGLVAVYPNYLISN